MRKTGLVVWFYLFAFCYSSENYRILTDDNYESVISFSPAQLIAWCDLKNLECAKVNQILISLSENEEYKNVITFGTCDCKQNPDVCLDLNVKRREFKKKDALVISAHVRGNLKPVIFNGEISEDSFKSFIHFVLHGDCINIKYEDEFANYKIDSEGEWFIDYYKSWCSQCQFLEQPWKTFSTLVKKDPDLNDVKIAKVDCDRLVVTCQSHGITGYPMLYYHRNGRHKVYRDGDRSIPKLKQFLIEARKTPFEELEPNIVPPQHDNTPEVPEPQLFEEPFSDPDIQ